MSTTRRDFLKTVAGKRYPNIRDFAPSAHKKRLAAIARVAAATRAVGVTTDAAAAIARAMGRVLLLVPGSKTSDNYSSARAQIWREP